MTALRSPAKVHPQQLLKRHNGHGERLRFPPKVHPHGMETRQMGDVKRASFPPKLHPQQLTPARFPPRRESPKKKV